MTGADGRCSAVQCHGAVQWNGAVQCHGAVQCNAMVQCSTKAMKSCCVASLLPTEMLHCTHLPCHLGEVV